MSSQSLPEQERISGDSALLDATPACAGAWDELREPSGRLREPWHDFARCMAADARELDRRCASLAQQVRADGITHNVYGDKGAAARAWPLELLPQLIAPDDWRRIERGVAQRARLYEAMLHDLYGTQRLLHEALLPATLLFRHAGYLRPLIGAVPPLGVRQFIVAFDLAHGPDGHWWVVSQRTQNPSGLGYVMHNRLLVSRQFPTALRDMRVLPLASAYRHLLDAVRAAAADVSSDRTPRVALLTPGPYNETYFEHAYLARFLGLPLVEGGDLTVRDERLYLKTVEGLEPVHALLRRLDDEYCDPLELRADSALGVAGLVQAVRAGHVVLANALGSAFLETPAVQGFLPAIATRLLGEGLQMPSLPTWWCGERAAWDDVRTALANKVIRPTYLRGGGQAHALHDDASRASWTRRVDADPDAFTVQGRVALSEAPVWQGGRVAMRPAVLRVYAIAGVDGRWHVLPGGMTRVAGAPGASVSMQFGGRSLDTWVLAGSRADDESLGFQSLPVDDTPQPPDLVTSRTAENLFWLGRYTERARQLARLARCTLDLIGADDPASTRLRCAVSNLAQELGLVPLDSPRPQQQVPSFAQTMLASLDAQGEGFGLGFCLRAMARAADSLRERLAPDQWRQVWELADDFSQRIAPPAHQALLLPQQAWGALDHLATQLKAVTRAQTAAMGCDPGGHLFTAGVLIERLLGAARLLREFAATHGPGVQPGPAIASPGGIDLLLTLADSDAADGARSPQHTDLPQWLHRLVLDDSDPCAWAGIARQLREQLGQLPGGPKLIDALQARLPALSVGLAGQALRGLDDGEICERLLEQADDLIEGASRLADDLARRYFAHTPGGDQLLSS